MPDGAEPVIQRRQALAGELRVRGRFEPADAADRIVRLPFGIASRAPMSTGPGRPVASRNACHRLVERQLARAVAERLASSTSASR